MEVLKAQGQGAAKVLVGILVTAAIFFSAWLLFGPKPWIAGVAAAESASEKVRTGHHVVTGLWRAAWLNLAICLALLPFARRLARPLTAAPPKFSAGGGTETVGARRWVLLALLGATALTLVHAVPRLDHGLWHDEAKGVSNFVVGRYQHSKTSDEVRYREVTPLETVWNYRFPNHTLYGILARTAHTALPAAEDRPDRFYVNEAALRLPSLAGALGGLAATALLLLVLRMPRAAALAPLLLSAHPWFLRYAAEARGYSLLFLFGPLCIALAVKGLQDGRWRWWIGFGLCQFLLIWSVLNSLYLLLVLNIAVLVWLIVQRRQPAVPALAGRWFLGGMLTTSLVVMMMTPLLPQFLAYVEDTGGDSGKYGSGIVRDMLSAYTAGMRYQEFGGGGGGHMRGNLPAMLFAALAAALALCGAWSFVRRGLSGRLMLAVLLLPAPLFYLHCTIKQPHIFYWYVIFGLPLFWAVVAAGCVSLGDKLLAKTRRPALAVGLLLFAALWFTGAGKRRFLSAHPIEAERDSVLAARGAFSDPTAPAFADIVMLGFSRDPILYDVRSEWATDASEFAAALARADLAGKPLFVNYGPAKSYQHHRDIMELVDDPDLFETIAEFEGIDEGSDRVVKRYRAGAIAGRANDGT